MNHWDEVTYSLTWAAGSMLAAIAIDRVLSQSIMAMTGLTSIGLFIYLRASGEGNRLADSSRLHPFFAQAFEIPFWMGFFMLVRGLA